MTVYSTVYSRSRSQKTSKIRVTGLCEGNSPVTVEFTGDRHKGPVTRKMFPFWWRSSCVVFLCTTGIMMGLPIIHVRTVHPKICAHVYVFLHLLRHDDVIKWKHFSHYWAFVRGIHRSPVNSPKGQWRGTLMFSLICAYMDGWVNNLQAGDLRRHRDHYDVTVMVCQIDTCHFYPHSSWLLH